MGVCVKWGVMVVVVGQVLHCDPQLITLRATGELATAATWMRSVIVNHPEYKQVKGKGGKVAKKEDGRVCVCGGGGGGSIISTATT